MVSQRRSFRCSEPSRNGRHPTSGLLHHPRHELRGNPPSASQGGHPMRTRRHPDVHDEDQLHAISNTPSFDHSETQQRTYGPALFPRDPHHRRCRMWYQNRLGHHSST
eukprot:1944261-Rhodomonas_salina.1